MSVSVGGWIKYFCSKSGKRRKSGHGRGAVMIETAVVLRTRSQGDILAGQERCFRQKSRHGFKAGGDSGLEITNFHEKYGQHMPAYRGKSAGR